jgi:hypothetical protein
LENTEIVRKGLYDNSKLAHAAWNDYFKKNEIGDMQTYSLPPDPTCQEYSNNVTVGPLLPVTWGQSCSYNELCPTKNCTNVCDGSPAAWTGCVATAAAQIIRYWQPTTVYNYNYASMPATFGNGEVQRLMRDLGLSSNLNMDYGCDGSSASSQIIPLVLQNKFGFTSGNYINYDVSTFARVQNNLANHWPVLLGGCNTRTNVFLGLYSYDDCHEWVCDGYSETDLYYCNEDGTQGGSTYLSFHMNWGWHETYLGNDYNGWYSFNNWNIPGINRNYQYAKDAVVDIHP